MQTDVIRVLSDGTGREEALLQVEKFGRYLGLDSQQELWVRLLSEETLGMVAAITHDFKGEYWLESEDGVCSIHLKGKTEMDSEKKEQLLAASTSGKNEAAKGFMGKIRDIFQNGLNSIEDANRASMEFGADPLMFTALGIANYDAMEAPLYSWSLQHYRESVASEMEKNPKAEAAWDELEKSIVAKLADEVKVSIVGDTVEMVIEKRF